LHRLRWNAEDEVDEDLSVRLAAQGCAFDRAASERRNRS
jgi:hypothetical protein